MKLGPLLITRNHQNGHHAGNVVEFATPTAEVETSRPRPERGASGTVNYGGYLQPAEYLAALQGAQGLKVYERMRRSDPSVREALWHLMAPILKADWDIEPAGDDPDQLEQAAFVKAAYFDWLETPWRTHIRQCLTHLPLGFSVFETTWQVVDREIEWEDPHAEPEPDPRDPTGRRLVRPRRTVRRQWLTWRTLAQRLAPTVTRWVVDNGDLVAVEQQVFRATPTGGSWETVTIPAEDLLVFVNEQEGDDFWGLPLLRSAYKPWLLKETVEKVAAVSVERHGVGINVAYVPERSATDSAVISRVEEMLRQVRAGEQSYLVFPGPKALGAQSQDGYLFEVVSPEGSLPDQVGFLEYLRGELKGNVLARFAELGHGSVGARATGDVQSEVWRAAAEAVAGYVADVHNDRIRRLVRVNYDTDRFPRLVFSGIDTKSLEEFARAVSLLVGAGALKADRSLREWTRRSIGAPDEDLEVEEEPVLEGEIEEEGGPLPVREQRRGLPAPDTDADDADDEGRGGRAPARMSEEPSEAYQLAARFVEMAEQTVSQITDTARALAEIPVAQHRPPDVHVHVPAPQVSVEKLEVTMPAQTITVEAPQVTVEPAAVTVEAPTVNVDVQPADVRVEAPTIVVEPAPVHVEVQPAPPAAAKTAHIQRDPATGRAESITIVNKGE